MNTTNGTCGVLGIFVLVFLYVPWFDIFADHLDE